MEKLFLFISPAELSARTIIGGSVDFDKTVYIIESVMVVTVEKLLGTELYDKIYADWQADTLTGDYETLFKDYVQPITLYQTAAEYLEIAHLTVMNGGVFTMSPDNADPATPEELQILGNKYSQLAQARIERFYKWICKNYLPEYKTYQDEVSASKSMNLSGGLWFGRRGDEIQRAYDRNEL